MLLLLLLQLVGADSEPPTTKTYELAVPGSDPIRIYEAEPLWGPRSEHRAYNVGDPLQKFLANYAGKVKKHQSEEEDSAELPEKSKSWDLLYHQRHNHPFDEKKGWVSLEPVPWSVSKIAKWQSKYRPNRKPWESQEESQEQPPSSYNMYIHNKPHQAKPEHPHQHKNCKPAAHISSHLDDFDVRFPYGSSEGEIITDGSPPDFPHGYEAAKRRGSDLVPSTHPFSGEGDWVLLSTTKGYKYPQTPRQRSLQATPESLGAHRTVRLTVLPPAPDSNVNMTTSHGGLLQVESTFQTVEQSRKQLSKKKKAKRKSQVRRPARQQALPSITTTQERKGDSSALLAAVGAGMIPATMAMLVPMAMGGRRRKRAVKYTAPRYFY